MTRAELLGFRYRVERSDSANRTLLLLHGTGADENDLIPLGESLDSQANLLSPRGKVVEGETRVSSGVLPKASWTSKT